MASLPWHLPPSGLCVYGVSQGFSHHFGSKSANLHVYDIALCFLHVSKPLRPESANQIAAQMRCAGNFNSILHDCPRGICHSQCAHAGFHAISPGFRTIVTTCLHKIRMKFEWACVSQGISPRFGVVSLAPLPPRVVRL